MAVRNKFLLVLLMIGCLLVFTVLYVPLEMFRFNHMRSHYFQKESTTGFLVLLFPKKDAEIDRALLCGISELDEEYIFVENEPPEKVLRTHFTVYPPDNAGDLVRKLNNCYQVENGIWRDIGFSIKNGVVELKAKDTRGRIDSFYYRVNKEFEFPLPIHP